MVAEFLFPGQLEIPFNLQGIISYGFPLRSQYLKCNYSERFPARLPKDIQQCTSCRGKSVPSLSRKLAITLFTTMHFILYSLHDSINFLMHFYLRTPNIIIWNFLKYYNTSNYLILQSQIFCYSYDCNNQVVLHTTRVICTQASDQNYCSMFTVSV